ncbi:DUF1844 domain-containing protein [Granulicella sibirica]|nr:DUF1844 domain-containing protein [Granulicella sibirica]
MAEQSKPFVITDRRRHTMDGDLRPDADPSPEKEERERPAPVEEAVSAAPVPEAVLEPEMEDGATMPQAPSAEQMEQARMAYEQTADRLSTAIRAANPGMNHPSPMNFDGLVQSIYMTAIMQLGGATPEGQQPQVDLMGAQQSIEMLGTLAEKTAGNLSVEEAALLDRAVFEVQVAFLEITQALARSAAAKQQQQQGQAPGFGQIPGGRPSIVR